MKRLDLGVWVKKLLRGEDKLESQRLTSQSTASFGVKVQQAASSANGVPSFSQVLSGYITGEQSTRIVTFTSYSLMFSP